MLVVWGSLLLYRRTHPAPGLFSAAPTPVSTGAEGQHRAGLPRGRQGALPHRRCHGGEPGDAGPALPGLWGCGTGAGTGPRGHRIPPGSSRRVASELSVLPFRASNASAGPVSAARSLRTGTPRGSGHPPGLSGTGEGLPGLPTPPSRTVPSGEGAVERWPGPTRGRNQNRTRSPGRVRRLGALGKWGGTEPAPRTPPNPPGYAALFATPALLQGRRPGNIWTFSRTSGAAAA